jgi:hypothetical protein
MKRRFLRLLLAGLGGGASPLLRAQGKYPSRSAIVENRPGGVTVAKSGGLPTGYS